MLQHSTALSTLILAVLACCCQPAASADTVQLKDSTAVVGKILAEKPDQIAVDIGFTVLLIPRDHIVAIIRSEPLPPPATKPLASPKAAAELASPPITPTRENGVQVLAPGGATLILKGEAASRTDSLELRLPAGTYTVTRAGEGPVGPGATPRVELGGTNAPGLDLRPPPWGVESGESAIGQYTRYCRAEAERIEAAARAGRFFMPATAKGAKTVWEDWKSRHQAEFDQSPELQKAWLGVIRAINMNTPGAM